MYFSIGTATKTYMILTVFATACSLVTTYLFLQEKEDVLIQKKQLQLLKISSALERNIDMQLFVTAIDDVDRLPISQDEKAIILNKWLQPVLLELSNKNPDYGLGIYSRQLERIVAIGPEFNEARLIKVVRPESRKIYQSREPEYTQFNNSTGWGGKPVINIAYPIVYQGELVGHTWASAKTEDVMVELQVLRTRVILYAVVIWVIILAVIWLAFNKWSRGLMRLAAYIKNQQRPEALKREFPELRCLIEEISCLRDNLESEHQQREKVLQEMARIDRFESVGDIAASIGHEVRNPMTTVRGYLQLFQRKAHFAEHAEQINTMIEELDRANSIITEFLSLAKNKTVNMKIGNLNTVIHALYPLLQADALRRGHEVFISLDEIPNSEFDENEIRQLILNLVRNGLEAMQHEGVVTIRTYTYGKWLILSIEDTGAGIQAEILPKLGVPFITTKEAGTGLGLPVCYRIAERHGAKISVQTGNTGTTFIIQFRLSIV